MLYLLGNTPLLLYVKIGVTRGKPSTRAKSVSTVAPGKCWVIGFMFWPFMAYYVEQLLHFLLAPIRVEFYKGSGHKEWFFFIAAVVFYPLMLANWLLWFTILQTIFSKL